MSSHRIEMIVFIIAITITIFGWFITNSKNISFVSHSLLKKYHNAQAGFERLQLSLPLGEKDIGFQEICDLLVKKYIRTSEGKEPAKGSVHIYKIVKSGGGLQVTNSGSANFINMQIFIKDQPTLQDNFIDIESNIEKIFLKRPIFMLGTIIFWLGIIINILNETLRPKGRSFFNVA